MDLNYLHAGRGEPVVLIHGTGSQLQIWQPVVDRLASDRELFALDLPGFGDSPPLPGRERATPAELACVVVDFLDRLGIESPHLVGNSNGAWIALEIAKRGRARSVLGISPMGLWKDSVPLLLDYPIIVSHLLARRLFRWYETIWSRRWLRSAFMISLVGRPLAMPAEVSLSAVENLGFSPGFMATVRGLRDSGHFQGGEGLRIPVTLAFGARDMGIRMRDAKRHAEVPAHTRWISLPGCGHVPFFDDPELVAGVMREATATESLYPGPAATPSIEEPRGDVRK